MTGLEELLRTQLYSEELGIDLSARRDREVFKWFLASVLYGGRIAQTIARNTYKAFEWYGLLTPRKIIGVGWEFLVDPIMREGGYVRYDGRKSTQILRDCEFLLSEYQGSFSRLHLLASSPKDLEERVQEFYGVGPVTANIFLRELRPYWHKADPEPLPVVRESARALRIPLGRFDRKSIAFARLEAGLVRRSRSVRALRTRAAA